MGYVPEDPPNVGDAALRDYMFRELSRVSDALASIEGILLPELHVEPDKPRDGMVVLADGTDWNPGSGAGYYGRRGSSWVFLG